MLVYSGQRTSITVPYGALNTEYMSTLNQPIREMCYRSPYNYILIGVYINSNSYYSIIFVLIIFELMCTMIRSNIYHTVIQINGNIIYNEIKYHGDIKSSSVD